MPQNILRNYLSEINYSPGSWVPVLLPKDGLQKLLKDQLSSKKKRETYFKMLKKLQKKFAKDNPFAGMTKEQIMKKLHQTRKQILKENPNAYINYHS